MAEGWYTEKLRKVRKYDAADRSENEGHRVSGDYAAGRRVPCGTEAYYEWLRKPENRLSATERVLVADCRRHGIPVAKRCQERRVENAHHGLFFPVYLDNGRKVLMWTLEEALERLATDEHAVKMWDGTTMSYLTK